MKWGCEMKDDNFIGLVLMVGALALAAIIPFAHGYKSGYDRCMLDAVENKCAEILIVEGKIKYQWKNTASASAELK